MAGLLGEGWDDPKSSAIMALAGGLLRKDFGGGLLGASNAFAEAKNNALKQQYMGMQMKEMESQAALRSQQAALAQRRATMFDNWMGQLDGAPQQANEAVIKQTGGLAPTLQNAALQTQAQGQIQRTNPLFGIPREAVMADLATNDGKNIAEWMFKRGTPDWRVDGSYRWNANAPDVQPGFMPRMDVSQSGQGTLTMPGTNGLPQMAPIPGAVDAYRQFRQVDEAAKAGSDLVQVYNEQAQRMEFVPRSQVLSRAQPQPAPVAPARPASASEAALRPQVTGDMGPNPAHIQQELTAARRDIQRVSDPASKAQLQAYISDLEQQQARLPAAPAPMAAGPSASEKLSSEAGGKINDSWIKTSYEPTLASGQAARDLLDTVQVTRQAMENMGRTGWSTQTQAAGAAILSGMGVAPQNAKLFAANAEIFQSKVMERNWQRLNEAKGPQTEGDASRSMQTWAQLKNTPQANAYMLDMTEAMAQRDEMKARFYQQAQPIARKKGDLSEVDREWAKRSPSIFKMPTMQKWLGGIK